MGPAISILVREKLKNDLRSAVISKIHLLSDKVRGDDFWMEDAPFVYGFGWEMDVEQNEYNSLKDKIGWAPQDQLIFAALRNQPEDYFKLGDLCVTFTQMFKGYVEFGLPLSDYTQDRILLGHNEHVNFDQASLLGPSLMQLWRHHKDYWMVK